MAKSTNNQLKEALFEYDQLRKEILQCDILSLQILAATLLIVAAIMGICFTKQVTNDALRGFLFVSAQILAGIAFLQVVDRANAKHVLATYIRVFTEPLLDFAKYETRLYHYRSLRHEFVKDKYGEEYFGFHKCQRYVYEYIIWISLLFGSISFFLASPLCLLILIPWAFATYRFVKWLRKHYVKYFADFDKEATIWQTIKKMEEEG